MPYGVKNKGPGAGMDWVPGSKGGGSDFGVPDFLQPTTRKYNTPKVITPGPPIPTNPTTRASERLITNSGSSDNSDGSQGGTVDTENRAGGRKRRARNTAFASQELLG